MWIKLFVLSFYLFFLNVYDYFLCARTLWWRLRKNFLWEILNISPWCSSNYTVSRNYFCYMMRRRSNRYPDNTFDLLPRLNVLKFVYVQTTLLWPLCCELQFFPSCFGILHPEWNPLNYLFHVEIIVSLWGGKKYFSFIWTNCKCFRSGWLKFYYCGSLLNCLIPHKKLS